MHGGNMLSVDRESSFLVLKGFPPVDIKLPYFEMLMENAANLNCMKQARSYFSAL